MDTAFLWTGHFDSEKAFLSYANPSKRNCPWYQDFPYSDDVIASYHQAFRGSGESLRDALLRLHYSAGYLDAALKKLKQQKRLDAVNAVQLVYMKQRDAKTIDVKAWPQDKPLRFLGQFDFEPRKTPLLHPDAPTEPRYDHAGMLSIWIGTAKSKAEADQYFAEDAWDEAADDDGPSSPFGRDWKLTYDHDYLFYEAYAKPLPVAKLLAKWPDMQPCAAAAQAVAAQLGLTTGNLVVVAYDLDYTARAPFSTSNPAGYQRHPGKPKGKTMLTFVGAFQSGKG